jgi:anion-transporting  ArsA/GET3 family ATPase
MKIRHNPNGAWDRPSATVDDDYEAQVQRSTQKAERLYARAQKRLEKAEAQLAAVTSAKSAPNRKRRVAEVQALVELRRAELAECERMMTGVPASAAHRGRESFRPIAFGGPS